MTPKRAAFLNALATSMFTMMLTLALIYTYLYTIVNMDPELGRLRLVALLRVVGINVAPDGFGE
jgi:hypothetical protein